MRCEELIKEEFGENCNFDVDDAVQKLEKLGIVARVRFPFSCVAYDQGIISISLLSFHHPKWISCESVPGSNTNIILNYMLL